jgi:hypothetical protein
MSDELSQPDTRVDDNDESGREQRAERLRKQIEQSDPLGETEDGKVFTDDAKSTQRQPGESPLHYVQRRSREIAREYPPERDT